MAKKKLVVDEGLINSCLPDTPKGFTRRIEKVSARIFRVMLEHHYPYTYTTDKVSTVWGFIKGENVHKPKNVDKPQRESVCHILDAGELSSYTAINTEGMSLPTYDD